MAKRNKTQPLHGCTHAWEFSPGHVAEILPQMPVGDEYRKGIHVQSDEAVRLAAMHGLPIPDGYKFHKQNYERSSNGF